VETQSFAQGVDAEGSDGEGDGRERQHDEIHPEKNRHPADHASEQKMVPEKSESPAGEAVRRRCAEGDDEVQRESQTPDGGTATSHSRIGLGAEEAARDAVRHAGAEGEKGGGAVDDAGGETARHNGGDDDRRPG